MKSCFRQGVTLKHESEMLEMTNQACGCLEGKARSRQDRLSKQKEPLSSHFLQQEGLWYLSFSSGAMGELTGTLVGGETRSQGCRAPHTCFNCGPSLRGLLLVSNHPSASILFYFYFVFYILCFLLPSHFSRVEEHRMDTSESNVATISMNQSPSFKLDLNVHNTPTSRTLELFPYLLLEVSSGL